MFQTNEPIISQTKEGPVQSCMTYKKGDPETKAKLEITYKKHEEEKNEVRSIKKDYKEKVEKGEESKLLLAAFDLQQVITLPKSNESAVFYKRRITVFNFTVYNIVSRDCTCFTWSETVSKRGSSEIASCVYDFLKGIDDKSINHIMLFSDGCSGQNRNTIIATMLVYFVTNSTNIKEVSLRFFEPFHGQNEGDSAHSAISTAMSLAGDILTPAQLLPIFRLAKKNNR